MRFPFSRSQRISRLIYSFITIMCGALLLGESCWPVAPVALAQENCAGRCPLNSVSVGTITINARAQKSGETFFWVLQTFPGSTNASDLNVTDTVIQQQIKAAINEAATGGEATQFGFSGNADFDFSDTLNQQLGTAGLTFIPADNLKTPPTSETALLVSTLCVCRKTIGPTPTPTPVPPQNYRVVVVIKTAFAAQAAGNDQATPTIQIENTASNLPVRLFFTRQDLKNASTDPTARANPQARVVDELTKTAQQIIASAQAQNLLDANGKLIPALVDDPNLVSPGELSPDRRTPFVVARDSLNQALRERFDLRTAPPNLSQFVTSQVRWSGLDVRVTPCSDAVCNGGPAEPCNQLCGTPPQPTFVINLEGLQIVRHLAIKVQPDALDAQFKNPEDIQQFNELRRNVAKKLNREFIPKFAAQPGHVVTWEKVEQDRRLLCQKSGSATTGSPSAECHAVAAFNQISSPAKRQRNTNNSTGPMVNTSDTDGEEFNNDSALLYEVMRKRKTPGALGISAGGRYSPEENFLGTVGIKEYNLLGFGQYAFKERISLDFARGADVEKLRFQLSRPFDAPDRAGPRIKNVSAEINYFRDNDQRLGNLTPEEIKLRELGSNAGVTFGYDSFAPNDYLLVNCDLFKQRKRNHLTINGEAALGFRDLDIPESQKLLKLTGLSNQLLPQANTQIAPLSLDMRFTFSHDARRLEQAGLGQVSFTLDTELQRGLELFGADYKYNKASVTARAEVVFGALSPDDFFLRYAHGVGRSSQTTPVTELFRLGGLQNVRGMEEGEFIGRRLAFGQAEFGVNVFSLWHMLRGTPATELNRTPCSKSAGTDTASSRLPFDPASIYVKTFFDFAHITDPTSYRSGAGNLQLDRRVNGYGFAVELRNLGADIGAPISFSFGYARSPQSLLHRSGTLFTGVSYSF